MWTARGSGRRTEAGLALLSDGEVSMFPNATGQAPRRNSGKKLVGQQRRKPSPPSAWPEGGTRQRPHAEPGQRSQEPPGNAPSSAGCAAEDAATGRWSTVILEGLRAPQDAKPRGHYKRYQLHNRVPTSGSAPLGIQKAKKLSPKPHKQVKPGTRRRTSEPPGGHRHLGPRHPPPASHRARG